MEQTPTAIAESNFDTALDQAGAYESETESLACHLVNAVDTAREYRVSAEATAEAFLRAVKAHLADRPT